MKHYFLGPLVWLALQPMGWAAQTSCPKQYAQGQGPEIHSAAMAQKTQEVCYTEFGVMHSGITRTPLWSAQYMTPAQIKAADGLDRKGQFFAEAKIPPDDRAVLFDYKGSGYDRGHMTPSGDMPTLSSQQESFSLANIVPQAAKINQGIWAAIERAVREQVSTGQSLYIITGPMFEGSRLEQINGRVLVPTSVFKAIYDPKEQTAAAYVVTNQKDARSKQYDVISIAELEQRLKITLFPGMPENVRQIKGSVPAPAK